MPTMHSHRHNRSRWDHVNTPDGLRRRRAAADARREALAATLPPDMTPQPLAHWQRIVIDLYVPTSGRCDQHAVVIDGQRVGLLSATQIGVRVRGLARSRPSLNVLTDARQNAPVSARDWMDAEMAEAEQLQSAASGA